MTLYIVIVTVIVSLAGFYNQEVYSKLLFNPYSVKHFNQWYRMVSCGLLHADFVHLFVNMYVLYSFGTNVEYYYALAFGKVAPYIYLLMYISSIFAANVSTFFKYQNNSHYNSLGASGAVSAVLFTFILFNPYSKMGLLFLPGLEIPAILMGIGYLVYSYYMTKRESGDNINHEAHFYGAIYGVLFTVVFKPMLLVFFLKQLTHFGG